MEIKRYFFSMTKTSDGCPTFFISINIKKCGYKSII